MSSPPTQAMTPIATDFGVMLRIRGDALDLDDISRTLGVAPTCISENGKRYGHAKTLCDCDAWFFSVPLGGERPLDEHLHALWDRVRPRIDYLRDLTRTCDVSVSLHVTSSSHWFGKDYHTCFDVSLDSVALFGELGIPFRVFVTIKERPKE